jgi:hypothetical protein
MKKKGTFQKLGFSAPWEWPGISTVVDKRVFSGSCVPVTGSGVHAYWERNFWAAIATGGPPRSLVQAREIRGRIQHRICRNGIADCVGRNVRFKGD